MRKAELAETVKAAQSGDRDAVEKLYRLYRERIWFFVCKNIGSKQAATLPAVLTELSASKTER